jgi:hypothetical protein
MAVRNSSYYNWNASFVLCIGIAFEVYLDEHLIALWLYAWSPRTVRVDSAEARWFMKRAGKPLVAVMLANLMDSPRLWGI